MTKYHCPKCGSDIEIKQKEKFSQLAQNFENNVHVICKKCEHIMDKVE